MTKTNKEVISDWIEKKLPGEGDPFEDLAQEFTLVVPGPAESPIFRTHRGVEEFKKLLGLLSAKASMSFKLTDCISEGNKVVACVDEIFTFHTDPSKQYVNRCAWLFTLNADQKIIHFYAYDDTKMTAELFA
jgi:ketosteroid isomerase-like protein